jgi:dimethylhistidine N-methyltransferase
MQITRENSKFSNQFAADVYAGLKSSPKKIPSRYFYDSAGSQLFKEITQLPEYYLTKCEEEIILDNSPRIVDIISVNFPESINLIEFGAGDTEKPFPLIAQILAAQLSLTYTAIDISDTALSDLSFRVLEKFPDLKFQGLNQEYFEALNSVKIENNNRNLVLFLGSNIGNFNHDQSIDFLVKLNTSLNPGDYLLIGFDLKKDNSILIPAYDDAAGITRKFNMNLLERINRELGGNFHVDNFYHRAIYNDTSGAMESFLLSNCVQDVYIEKLRQNFNFTSGERIHTESSHKYDLNDIDYLAEASGFKILESFLDSRKYFACSLWQTK